ncbi:MAG: hypothetical protein JWM95_1097 [Gemmatimonadetes bacterium]|nr:hypothetical protein [Gemmatimonadota bacterium]
MRSAIALLAVAAVACGGNQTVASGPAPAAVAERGVPSRLADSTFWRMVTQMSEPDGFFRSDNLVGNEVSLQWVIPTLRKELGTGNVYLGVAPDQNFTYMIALQPKIVFIVDIRRGAMLQHLLYKAIFELAPTRADFLSMLFSRPRPAGLTDKSTVVEELTAFAPLRPDSATYVKNFAAIKHQLMVTHGFTLGPKDLDGIEYVYNAFYQVGPNLTYNFNGNMVGPGGTVAGGGGGFGGGGFNGFGRGMPSYGALLLETDGAGENHSYLASEDGYRWLRDYQSRNLLVPVIGDFAGPKALRSVGQWVRDHDAKISAMYVSNVEQYLFMSPDAWSNYYKNVATLPLTDNALFIRSYSSRGFGNLPQQSPNGSRSLQLRSSVPDLLKAFAEGKVTSYQDVIEMTRPARP